MPWTLLQRQFGGDTLFAMKSRLFIEFLDGEIEGFLPFLCIFWIGNGMTPVKKKVFNCEPLMVDEFEGKKCKEVRAVERHGHQAVG